MIVSPSVTETTTASMPAGSSTLVAARAGRAVVGAGVAVDPSPAQLAAATDATPSITASAALRTRQRSPTRAHHAVDVGHCAVIREECCLDECCQEEC